MGNSLSSSSSRAVCSGSMTCAILSPPCSTAHLAGEALHMGVEHRTGVERSLAERSLAATAHGTSAARRWASQRGPVCARDALGSTLPCVTGSNSRLVCLFPSVLLSPAAGSPAQRAEGGKERRQLCLASRQTNRPAAAAGTALDLSANTSHNLHLVGPAHLWRVTWWRAIARLQAGRRNRRDGEQAAAVRCRQRKHLLRQA